MKKIYALLLLIIPHFFCFAQHHTATYGHNPQGAQIIVNQHGERIVVLDSALEIVNASSVAKFYYTSNANPTVANWGNFPVPNGYNVLRIINYNRFWNMAATNLKMNRCINLYNNTFAYCTYAYMTACQNRQ